MGFIKYYILKLILQSVFHHILVAALSNNTFRKDYTFISETESFYKFHTDQSSWQEAKKKCEKEGTYLFYPENDQEADVVIRFWKETQPHQWIYIGVSSLSNKGEFKTIDGRPITEVYSEWRPGEPNDSNDDEDCVILQRDGKLNDDICTRQCAFICKKAQGLQKRKPLCNKAIGQSSNNFRKDYTFIPETKSFYKIHSKQSNWKGAVEKCQNEGTYLFYPENDKETDAVIDFWTKTQPNQWVYIGISRLSPKENFITIDGRPIADVYNNWAPGEPNNSIGDENCVILHRDSTLNDDICARETGFICKKSQESLDKEGICETPAETTDPIAVQSTSTMATVQLSTHFFRKDYKFIPETESFYKLHTIHSSWQEAKKKCAIEGTSLFFPENEQEAQAVTSFWNEKQPYPVVHIGISSLFTKGVFETIDGRSVREVYSNWNSGEPNDSNGEEDCVTLYRNGTLNDDKCATKFPFICKKSQATMEWNLLCDIPDLSYTYNEMLGKCYKLHFNPLNWTDAYSVCSAEQSYLAIINSQDESDLLARMIKEAPKDKFHGNYPAFIHLGYRKFEGEEWKNIKGQTLEDSGYNEWGSGQPVVGASCGSMFFNGELNNNNCDTKCFFVCEHDIDTLSNSLDERYGLF